MANEIAMYIVANDRVIDWTQAWFRSLQQTGYSGRICYIPWDDNDYLTRRLLLDSGKVELFDHRSFPEIQEIGFSLGSRLLPESRARWPLFYRFWPFFGPHSDFIYSDVDVVFLQRNPADLIRLRRQSGCDIMFVSHSHDFFTPAGLEQLGGRAYSAGFFAACRGSISYAELIEVAEYARTSGREWVRGEWNDQPYFNLVLKMTGCRHSAFFEQNQTMAASTWPNPHRLRRLNFDSEGKAKWWCPEEPENHLKDVWMVHWAGFDIRPWMPMRWLFSKYRWPEGDSLRGGMFWGKLAVKNGPGMLLNRITEWVGQVRRRFGRSAGRDAVLRPGPSGT